MAKQAIDKLKFNPPLGSLPVLQYLTPEQLQIDPSYQRSVLGKASQKLIAKIAMYWDWDKCLPLVVSRRDDGGLYVIDGQHRLEAARLRGDIQQLPCQIASYASSADEAANFVHLNEDRRPLSSLDLFKAAVASGDKQAEAIASAIESAGLQLAAHQNYISWKPGMVAHIGGIQGAWKCEGAAVVRLALQLLHEGFETEVQRYAGTLWPGVVELAKVGTQAELDRMAAMLRTKSQVTWRSEILEAVAGDPDQTYKTAAAKILLSCWGRWQSGQAIATPVSDCAMPALAVPTRAGMDKYEQREKGLSDFCDQCDRLVAKEKIASCPSRFCSLRDLAA